MKKHLLAIGSLVSLMLEVTPEGVRSVAVTDAHPYSGVHDVFDLTVDNSLHNFVANGVLVHNKSDPCDAASKCAADPPRTDAQKKLCKENHRLPDGGVPKCWEELLTLDSCSRSAQGCDADMKNDPAKTAANCKTQVDAYTNCLNAP